jgi:hypothetical protein
MKARSTSHVVADLAPPYPSHVSSLFRPKTFEKR